MTKRISFSWLAQRICFAITSANHQAKRQERKNNGDSEISNFEIGKLMGFLEILNCMGIDARLWDVDHAGESDEFDKVKSLWIHGMVVNVNDEDIFWQSKFISNLEKAIKKASCMVQ